jgi:hypothetical protein
MKNIGYSILASCTLAVVISFSSAGATAQTTPRHKPKPLATPTRVLSGAEIISQGGGTDDETVLVPVDTPAPRPSPSTNTGKIRDLNERVKKLESGQTSAYDESQKRMLMNLDIITRAEARTESLRKQIFELIDKENSIKTRMDQIDFDIQPAIIERNLGLQGGSMKPEEYRENRRKGLEAERRNLDTLLTSVQNTRTNLENNLSRAEQILDKLRAKLEKDIDDSLVEEKPDEQQ